MIEEGPLNGLSDKEISGMLLDSFSHAEKDKFARQLAEQQVAARQLIETGRIVGIQLLDHIIIGGNRPPPAPYVSLRDSGLVEFK